MGRRAKYGWALALFVALMMFALPVRANVLVRVLAYPFPPFLNEDMKSGLTVDLINLLNGSQSKFIFDLHVQSPKRRYSGIANGLYDVVFFEMPQWGWIEQKIDYGVTREIMTGGEVYIAARHAGRDQVYFTDLKTKKISAYFGYHYGFADFNSDREWLQQNFKIGLRNSHKRIIHLVENKKVDIGVVTFSYLKKYMRSNPASHAKLLISEKFDQHYSLPILVGPHSTISVKELEKILDGLMADGALQTLFEKNGLISQLTY